MCQISNTAQKYIEIYLLCYYVTMTFFVMPICNNFCSNTFSNFQKSKKKKDTSDDTLKIYLHQPL